MSGPAAPAGLLGPGAEGRPDLAEAGAVRRRSRLVTGLSSHGPLAVAGLGGLAALLGLALDPRRAWVDLLAGGFLFVTLALAGLALLAIHYLARAGWWVVLRRPLEAMAACLPAAAPLLLLLFFGREILYPWARPGATAGDAVLAAKAVWLSAPAFFLRMALYLAVWTGFALLLRRASRDQDRLAELAAHRRMVRLAALFVPVFAVSFSLASFDWLMSLEPHWYSTIFAVYTFAGLLLGGLAAVTLAAVVLARGSLAGRLGPGHLEDLGTLLFAFSIFWAYIWVSQYLLIWYGNLSEEIPYYLARTAGGWMPLFLLVPALEWLVPFLALMTRAAKRRPATLAWVAAVILAGRCLDLYVMVAPPVLGRPRLGPLDVAIAAGYLALFLHLARRNLARAPVLPLGDPYLAESLARRRA